MLILSGKKRRQLLPLRSIVSLTKVSDQLNLAVLHLGQRLEIEMVENGVLIDDLLVSYPPSGFMKYKH